MNSKRTAGAVCKRRALLVVGMHRSGTSALTRTLSLAGATLPRDLMASGPHNPEGHWEPMPVAELNDRMLAALGTRWDTPFAPPRTPSGKLALDQFSAEARKLIREQYGQSSLIVLKEPRLTILADFWIKALRDLRYDPAVIVIVRSPDEVAASLAARNDFTRNYGLLLWANYMAQAEILTRDLPRLICSYGELLTAPEKLLDRVEHDLGVTLPGRSAASAEIKSFLQRNLRHHHARPDAEQESRLGPIWRLAAWLDDLARGGSPAGNAAEEVAAWLAGLQHLFGPIFASFEQALRIEQARTRHVVALNAHLEAKLNIVGTIVGRCGTDVEMVRQASGPGSATDYPASREQFNVARYLLLNPDVAQSGLDPWEHFTQFGQHEGRLY